MIRFIALPAIVIMTIAGGIITFAQSAGLKIVVLEGEGAVNIIQQKTAVNPIIEVRDRNNLPVSGVAVTFSVGGQGASFGGASTLTLTTNAAGQAVVTGLTPTATGAVTINATAVVNGQTIAATITQTNFATAQAAAQAAASAGAGSSGTSTAGATAGGGGGGISGTTIGIVGAAVGGGALAATQLAGGGDEDGPTHSGTFSGQITLTFPGNSPQQSCTRVQNVTGTLRIALDEGSTNGTAEIEGSMVVSSVNCGSGPQLGATDTVGMPETQVTGSAAALAFTSEVANTFPAQPPSPSGINTVRFVFSGALNGNVITGSLTHSIRIESPGSGFPAGTGAATYMVTLQ